MSESIDGPSPLGLVHDAVTAVATMVTHGPAPGDQALPGRDGHRSEAQAAVGTEVLAELAQLARLLAPAATVAAGSPSADVAHHAQALGAALDAHQTPTRPRRTAAERPPPNRGHDARTPVSCMWTSRIVGS